MSLYFLKEFFLTKDASTGNAETQRIASNTQNHFAITPATDGLSIPFLQLHSIRISDL